MQYINVNQQFLCRSSSLGKEVQTGIINKYMFPFPWGFKEIQMNAKEQSKHTLHRSKRHSSAEQKKIIYFMKLYKQP